MFRPLVRILSIFVLLSAPVIACGENYERVSIIALIGQPDAYEGKKVMISGYLKIKHEGNALYLGKEDMDHVLTENAIWLTLKSDQVEKWQSISNNYAYVFGEFTTKSRGHFDLYPGALVNVYLIRQRPDFKKILEDAKAKEDVKTIEE